MVEIPPHHSMSVNREVSFMQPLQAPVAPSSADDDEIDLLALFGTLLDHKWMIAGITAGFLLTGALYAVLATPIYRASATIQVEQKSPGIPGLTEMSDILGGSQSQAVTEIQLLTSRNVIGKTVDKLHLDIDIQASQFPLIGKFLQRRHQPENPGDLAPPLLGMSRFAWGGESLEIAQLDVPNALLEKQLTLIAGEAGQFRLLDDNDDVLVEGAVAQPYEQKGIKLLVQNLNANP